MDIKKLVDDIIADNKITAEEKNRLNEVIMSDGKVTSEEQEQIKRIFQLIGEGKLKIEG